MTLPTFLIIGTMKGGTTSLHRYLRQHPEVFMPERKELNFFLDEYAGPPIDPPEERNWSRGITWYERQFAGAERERAVGEASANYSRYPTYPGVAERIAEVVPQMKLIYLMRNPIDRVLSHYLHDFANGREQRPLHDRGATRRPISGSESIRGTGRTLFPCLPIESSALIEN